MPAARGANKDADAGRCLSRSRGGLATKVHAAVDARGRLARLSPTAGNRHGGLAAPALLRGVRLAIVVADRVHDGGLRGRWPPPPGRPRVSRRP